MREGLSDTLKEYGDSDFYPFHMPGHKRNLKNGLFAEIYHYDITEIDGFDNLHQPHSLIKDAQERAARLYHSKETYFLVNGSTAGILSAVSAAAGRGKKLIIARNCHKAVYHAAFLNRMQLYYVYPEIIKEYGIAGEITVKSLEEVVERILSEKPKTEDEGIAGVVITSPTYEGIVSDVGKLSDLAHRYEIPLIVDQAHGAHFGIHPSYPENAVKEGADIVIHSVHKTLPAPTQTALLHRNGDLISGETLRKYLRIYQSSSPSYLLMAGIDDAVFLAGKEGYGRLERLYGWREDFLRRLDKCVHIQVCPATEPGKLVIAVMDSSITGQGLYGVLREKYHLQMEMAAENYVIAILTMMDEKEGIDRLLNALLEIDTWLSEKEEGSEIFEGRNEAFSKEGYLPGSIPHPRAVMSIWEAYTAPYREAGLEEAIGQTAAEFVNLYPPGIPLLVPGEELDKRMADIIFWYIKSGYVLQGVCENKIKVVEPLK